MCPWNNNTTVEMVIERYFDSLPHLAKHKHCMVIVVFNTKTIVYISSSYHYLTLLESLVYEKVYGALTNQRLTKGMKQASAIEQTSCLEGFHSTLNQFAPKMAAYSYVGMFCRYDDNSYWGLQGNIKVNRQYYRLSLFYVLLWFRHIIAALHFNYNLDRETVKDSDGQPWKKVTYPKFKNGEATVRDVHVQQSFGM